VRQLLLLFVLTLAIRLPFLNHPIQGDDVFFLSVAQRAQIDPARPNHFIHRASGIDVDMRGHLHPPGNSWILAGLLGLWGDVRELWFHAAYLVFSLGAVGFAWMLARRFAADPLAAVLVFIATPAFVINGNSLESDVPFLCFWLGAVALWVEGRPWTSAGFMAAAALTSYQAVALIPVLAAYSWTQPRRRSLALLLTPAVVLAAWQVYQWMATGAAPVAVAQGYLLAHQHQSLGNKVKNAVSMVTHLGWMGSPALHLHWAAVPVAALGAWLVDASPLYWIPFGCGAVVLARGGMTGFPRQWLLLFFGAAVVIFFAGSARYLLPLALPLAILTANRFEGRRGILLAATGVHLALGLVLAAANQQHWSGYQRLVENRAKSFVHKRVWTNAEWGLRYYAESAGVRPMLHGQPLRPGDLVLTSALGPRILANPGAGLFAPLGEDPVRPGLPFRLLGLGSRSGYSTNLGGFRAFDVTWAPADTVRLETVIARSPMLSYVAMGDAEAERHLVEGVYALEPGGWRWSAGRAAVILRRPERAAGVSAEFRLTEHAAGAEVALMVDGVRVAGETYRQAGLYTLRSSGPVVVAGEAANLVIVSSRPFRVPPDDRELGLILVGAGFVR